MRNGERSGTVAVPRTKIGRPRLPSRAIFRGVLARVGVVVAVASGLAACSGHQVDPRPTGEALAAGLSKLDLAGVAVSGATPAQAQAQLDAITAGLGGLKPVATVREVTPEDGGTATVTLAYRWPLGGDGAAWSYTSTARLTLVEDAWQVEWSPAIVEPHLAAGETLIRRTVRAKRGEILGAGGAVIVTDRPVLRTGIDKTRLTDANQAADSARALARLLDIDADAYAARVRAAGAKAFVEGLVLRQEQAVPAQQLAAIPGAVAIPGTLPLAPSREFARPLLGRVGEATAEQIAKGGTIVAGDLVGASGLQQQYDTLLRGADGVTILATPASDTAPGGGTTAGGTAAGETAEQAAPRVLFHRDPAPGKPLTTTIDPTMQERAEKVLAPVGPASALVAIRPTTGAVLAAASGPGGNGYSTATLGRYAPGSTFKVASSLALLRAGLTADSPVPCTETLTVDGKLFKNYNGYPASRLGELSLRTAFANSCNTAMIAGRDRVPQAALHEAAASLGLGQPPAGDARMFLGSVPAEAGSTEHAASMIGQGKVEASPLGMAVVAASVARGATVAPRLVTSGSSGTSAEPTPTAGAAKPLTQAEATALRSLMRAVVVEGNARFLADVAGPPVAAKTGTAEYGTEQPPRTHAWIIAVRGDLAVAVFVADAASGSHSAGPLLQEFLAGMPG